jgi:hypothetical protein
MGFEPQREQFPREGYMVFERVLDGDLSLDERPATNDLVGWKGNDEGEAAKVPARSVAAFSGYLLHTTGANRNEWMRWVYLAQYTPEVMLNPGKRQLRRNAVPPVINGDQVTRG